MRDGMIQVVLLGLGLTGGCSSSSFDGAAKAKPQPITNPPALAASAADAEAAPATAPFLTPAAAPASAPVLAAAAAAPALPTSDSSAIAPTSATPLLGLWDAAGYTDFAADGTKRPVAVEVLRISQEGANFVATKVTGDDAVPAGHISFFGTRNGEALMVQFYASGSAGGPIAAESAVTGTYSPSEINVASWGGNPPLVLTPHVGPSPALEPGD